MSGLMTRVATLAGSKAHSGETLLRGADKNSGLIELVEGVAHELNNNLAIALGHVQLLKLKIKDESIAEGLNRIEKSIFKCSGVVKAIREYAGGPLQDTGRSISLAKVLKDALDSDETSWKESATKKNLSIVTSGEYNGDTIKAEAMDLVTALSQLLHNAVDASPKNGRIEINISSKAGLIILTIADQGKGISENLKVKIYEPFFTTKKEKGAGLGLTMVQSIASRFGGRIGFAPNSPKGTIFSISFPLIDAASREDSLDLPVNRETEKRILIVDDDIEVRNVLCDMLQLEGFKADTSSDAYSAMEMLEKGRFDLMITDLGMPGMSGYDLAEHVQDKHKEIEIVLMTGWGNSFDKNTKKLKAVKAVIAKPFHLNQILDLVRI